MTIQFNSQPCLRPSQLRSDSNHSNHTNPNTPSTHPSNSLSPHHSLTRLSCRHDETHSIYHDVRIPLHFQHHHFHHRHSSSSSSSSDSSASNAIRSPLMALPSPALHHNDHPIIPINLDLSNNNSHQTSDQSSDFFSIPLASQPNPQPTFANKTSGFFSSRSSAVLPPPRPFSGVHPSRHPSSPTHNVSTSFFDSPASSRNVTPAVSPPNCSRPSSQLANSSSPSTSSSDGDSDGTGSVRHCQVNALSQSLTFEQHSTAVSSHHPHHSLPTIPTLNISGHITHSTDSLNQSDQLSFQKASAAIPVPHESVSPHNLSKLSLTDANCHANANHRTSSDDLTKLPARIEPPSRHPTLVSAFTRSSISPVSSIGTPTAVTSSTLASSVHLKANTSHLVDPISGSTYNITRTLGEGSFSKVVEARNPAGTLVALKMIANDAVDQNERMKSSVGREIGVLQVGLTQSYGVHFSWPLFIVPP